jgi:glycerate-2-kinase
MKSDILNLFQTAIGAVDPYTCVKHHLVFNNNHLNDDEKKELHIGDNSIIFNHNVYVAAFGKAALGTEKFINKISSEIFLFFIRHVSSCG